MDRAAFLAVDVGVGILAEVGAESRSCGCQRSWLIGVVRPAIRCSRGSVSSRSSLLAWSSQGRSGSRGGTRTAASASIGPDLPRVRAEARHWGCGHLRGGGGGVHVGWVLITRSCP